MSWIDAATQRIIELEGFTPEAEIKFKGEKYPTTGYGRSDSTVKLGQKTSNSEALEDLKLNLIPQKIKIAKRLFPDFDNFSDNLKVELLQGVFRGDFKIGHDTVKHINNGDFNKASKEFLNHDEYRAAQLPDSGKAGIVPRMESISFALNNESTGMEIKDTPKLRPDSVTISPEAMPQEVPQPKSFNQAFGEARQQQGSGGTFEWNGNSYSTNMAGEVPAVAEPQFPPQELLPAVPSRVPSIASDRSGISDYQGLEVPPVGFKDGTSSVPGYKDGSNFISDFFNKYFNAGTVRNNQRVQEQEIINSVLDKNILDQENKEKAIMEAAQINAQRNALAVPKLPDEKIISAPIKLGVNDYTNQGISLNPPTEYADVEQARRLKQSIIDNSIADGSYGDPQAGFSQEVPIIRNTADGSYGDMQAGYNTTQVPIPNTKADGSYGDPLAGYLQPQREPINDMVPGENTFKYIPDQKETVDDMVAGENTFKYNLKEVPMLELNKMAEMGYDPAINEIRLREIRQDATQLEMETPVVEEIDSNMAEKALNDAKQKEIYDASSRVKDVQGRIDQLEYFIKLNPNSEQAKSQLEQLKNQLDESNLALGIVKDKNKNEVPKVKKESIVTKEDNTLSSTSKTEESKMRVANLNNEKIDLDDDKNKNLFNFTSDDVKEKVGSLLQTFFGLETADLGRAIGFYLASRATGASHEGSMRWAGTTVLKQAENNKVLNSKKSDATLTAFAKVRGNYTPEAGAKITKLLTEGKLVEAQALMDSADSKTTRGKLGIGANATGDFYITPGFTTSVEVFEGAGGNRYTKVISEKDGKQVESYRPISAAEMGVLRKRNQDDDDNSRLAAVRAHINNMPAGMFKTEIINSTDSERPDRPRGIFAGRSKAGVTEDIMQYSKKQRKAGLPDDPLQIMMMVSKAADLATSLGITNINAETLIDMQVIGGDILFDQDKISKDGELVAPSKIKSFTTDFQDILGNDRSLINTTMTTASSQFTPDMTMETIKSVPLYNELDASQKDKIDSAPSTFMALSLLTAYTNKPK
ncbi:hypothetical protein N9I05_01560 [Pseudomonadales bacterium]|nr:hypothetical protein [Pseudomonadales bacterium]